jgi:hypothetical protein
MGFVWSTGVTATPAPHWFIPGRYWQRVDEKTWHRSGQTGGEALAYVDGSWVVYKPVAKKGGSVENAQRKFGRESDVLTASIAADLALAKMEGRR